MPRKKKINKKDCKHRFILSDEDIEKGKRPVCQFCGAIKQRSKQ